MQNFILKNPTKLIFGKDSTSQIADEIRPFGSKVLVVYGGGSIKKNGIYEEVMEQLKGFEVKEFGGIEPNPRVETIREIIKEYKSFDPDFVLAVGGGSVIDGTKLLVSAMHYDGDAWDFLTNPDTEPKKYIPFGTVLTISATGSEMNSGSVITNWTTHEKPFFVKEQNYPIFSVVDPTHQYSLPKDQLAYGIIDAFSHVLEQYINTSTDTPLQDRFSEGILLTLIESAPKALKNLTDYNARADIAFSATMALNNLIKSGVNQDWATHVIEHAISAIYDIPHAAGLAIITPRWMEVVAKEQKPDKMLQYGKRIWQLEGTDKEIVNSAIEKTFDFFKSLGVKMSLAEWDITDEHFNKMAEELDQDQIGEFTLKKGQIRAILDTCLK